MNRIKHSIGTGAVLFALFAPAVALAQHHTHGTVVIHDGHHGYRDSRVWWGLGLGLGLGWEAGYYGYPYPWYYYPPEYYVAPTTVVVPSSPAPVPAPLPAPTWYYCDSLKSYYPSVDHCPEQWRLVPATPPPSQTTAR
ncbi:hypothetical protein AAKU67_001683 [Oxalobacteraceae bacterium GrIS 2.11]